MKKLIIIFVLLSLSCSKDDIKEVEVEPFELDHKGRVNKYTYVIMFSLLLICLMIAKMLF